MKILPAFSFCFLLSAFCFAQSGLRSPAFVSNLHPAGTAAPASQVWITAQSLGTLRTDGATGLRGGCKFTTGASGKTVTALGRYKINTNVLAHSIWLLDASCAVLASNVVDLSTGSVGTYVFVNITPVVLSAGTVYYLETGVADHTETTVEEWYGGDTTVTADAAFATINDAASGSPGCNPDSWGAAHTYVPINLKFQ